MKILITGSNGFIGRNLYESLFPLLNKNNKLILEEGCMAKETIDFGKYQIARLLKNVSEKIVCYKRENLIDTIIRSKPDIIIHLAANPLVSSGIKAVLDNIELTKNILAVIPKKCHFIFASSATVYGYSLEQSKIDGAHEQCVTYPNSRYGWSKLICENLIRLYALDNKDFSYTILRLTANVGPYATHGVVYDLVNKVKLAKEDSVEILGSYPGSIKLYTHVEDTVKAIILSINQLQGTNRIINVGTYSPISVYTIFEIICNKLGKILKPKWLGQASVWKGDNPYVYINNNVLNSIGWNPKYKTSKEAVYAAIE